MEIGSRHAGRYVGRKILRISRWVGRMIGRYEDS